MNKVGVPVYHIQTTFTMMLPSVFRIYPIQYVNTDKTYTIIMELIIVNENKTKHGVFARNIILGVGAK